MEILHDAAPEVHPSPLSDPEYLSWLEALDAGHYSDEPPTDESPDDIPAGFESESAYFGAAYRYFFGDFPPPPTDADDVTDYSAEVNASRARQEEAYYFLTLREREHHEDAITHGRWDGREWEEQEACRGGNR